MNGHHPLPTDIAAIDLLREKGPLSVLEMARTLGVTSTAVRQRLVRLMGQQFVSRSSQVVGRGRPSHKYELTAKGRALAGTNFADLACVLWDELRAVTSPEVRRGLLQRVAQRLAERFTEYSAANERPSPQADFVSVAERMGALVALFGDRQIPMSVGQGGEGGLPILTAKACPYPELAERDRSVCAMERMMFSEFVGEKLNLSACRLDGGTCCTFELA